MFAWNKSQTKELHKIKKKMYDIFLIHVTFVFDLRCIPNFFTRELFEQKRNKMQIVNLSDMTFVLFEIRQSESHIHTNTKCIRSPTTTDYSKLQLSIYTVSDIFICIFMYR